MTTVAVEGVDIWKAALLRELANRRREMGLTQAELADRIGVNRMTVQRAEGDDGDPQLSTFVAMTLALNLAPSLEKPQVDSTAPADLVHRGYSYERTKHNKDWDDRKREGALASAWEKVNAHGQTAHGDIISHLVPNCTQDQASAAATVIQWMGSDVGFEFLTEALDKAGFEVRKKAGS